MRLVDYFILDSVFLIVGLIQSTVDSFSQVSIVLYLHCISLKLTVLMRDGKVQDIDL